MRARRWFEHKHRKDTHNVNTLMNIVAPAGNVYFCDKNYSVKNINKQWKKHTNTNRVEMQSKSD